MKKALTDYFPDSSNSDPVHVLDSELWNSDPVRVLDSELWACLKQKTNCVNDIISGHRILTSLELRLEDEMVNLCKQWLEQH